MNEEQKNLVHYLQNAVNNVYNEERFLLNLSEKRIKGLEQAFVFRVGVHLVNQLNRTSYERMDLDSEYNKNHGGIKSSERFSNGLRPDLIIHRRGSNKENKLVVEFKGYWSKNIKNDIKKLEDLTNPKDSYRYLLGVLVTIGKEKATFRYFINGNEYKQE